MELTLCHASGAQNFEVAPTYLENLCGLVYTCIVQWLTMY